jgi:hypothetical protein
MNDDDVELDRARQRILDRFVRKALERNKRQSQNYCEPQDQEPVGPQDRVPASFVTRLVRSASASSRSPGIVPPVSGHTPAVESPC